MQHTHWSLLVITFTVGETYESDCIHPIRLNRCSSSYLVSTALLTVRRPLWGFSWLDTGALLVGLTAGLLGITFGMMSLGNANGEIDGPPGVMGFIFGAVALLGVIGDLRMMRARRI